MNNSNSKPTYWKLFISTFTLSAFTIGGGYVMVPLMKERFAETGLGWISTDELQEIIALGQSAPGAMVINATSILGYRLLGFRGALVAALGTALPPIMILALVGHFYEVIRGNTYVSAIFRGMRAGVAAVIVDTVVTMAQPYFKKDKAAYIAIMAVAFIAGWVFDVNVAFIIIASGILGFAMGAYRKRKEGAK